MKIICRGDKNKTYQDRVGSWFCFFGGSYVDLADIVCNAKVKKNGQILFVTQKSKSNFCFSEVTNRRFV